MILNLHSYYSLRYGTLSPEELVEGMVQGDYDTGVLTDINNSSGVLDAVRLGRKAGIRILPGMEYRDGDRLLYIGIARNPEGFRELNQLMTDATAAGRMLPDRAPGFGHAFVLYPFGSIRVAELRDNEYIGIRPSELNRIALDPAACLERYVILAPVSFRSRDYRLHTQLRAIDHNTLISQLQPCQIAPPDEVLLSRTRLLELYSRMPQLIRNTERLLSECRFDFDFKKAKNKETFTGNRYEDRQLLAKYAMDGFLSRYGDRDRRAKERILKELDIIDTLNFSSYFLITDDICRYARSRDFHYVGRGSGANSVVAYCLGITDVCPIELDLYFERFLNPKRNSPPDFDIDFSWNQRDGMYDYIFGRYPAGNVALMGTMTTFQGRNMIRELGKVYGLPKAEIDRLVHEPQHMLSKNEVTDMILSVCGHLKDFPNQRSIHASGVLISERPLTYYSALDYPPKGLPTVQYDMYVAEDIGFEKFDILSQRGIGHIRDCREIVRQNRGEIISTADPRRFFRDPRIAHQLKTADTIGCFYIESPAMRQLLTKLRCDNYLTLVAASSIIRPGVASSGMMKAYIERHHDPSRAVYPHPVFREHLEETYGVMVYQEDVMKIGHHYGGLDLADADVLRRMMSGKYRHIKHLLATQDKFFEHCKQMGYPEESSREIWRQMESFAGYSFNKAHSASFAVESYQSLYLKTYYPLEFMVAVLNNYGGFYNRKVYINEARKAGGEICLPCINRSVFNTSIHGTTIYLGFDCLLHLGDRLAKRIPMERERSGDYTGIENFILRTGAGLEQVIVLIRAGAFRFTGNGKKELLWEAHLLLSGQKGKSGFQGRSRQRDRSEEAWEALSLFDRPAAKPPVLPRLETSVLEDLYDEIELLGFPVSGSLFDLARSGFRGDAPARELGAHRDKTIRMVGDFVCDKDVRTRHGAHMKLGTFLDVTGHFFDTAHFPQSLARYPLRGAGLYLLEGKVNIDFGSPSLEVIRCGRMPLKNDPRSE